MSEDNNTLTVGNGPMTIRRSLNNILAALNIAQGKGAFNLRESAFVFTSLQKMNEFVNKYENHEEKQSEQTNQQSQSEPQPKSQPKPQSKSQPKPQLKKSEPKKLPDISLNDEEVVEEITI